jgi:4-amino-4-deoxy-L-arabinose transferase-like glycosyltransferase
MTTIDGHAPSAFRGQRKATLACVALIMLLFGIVASWNIGDAGFSSFYSSAARSMSMNWQAFFFGTFDPGATITLDKLSGFLVPQALSARLFGFSARSIALPQVLEGMVTVGASYVLACRWRGAAAGLLAAAMTAATPLLPSMFGHIMEDGLLTMSLALALMCWQSSILTGRLTPLVLSALWVAVGFQAKMMQAWVILPAIVIGMLLAEFAPLGTRIRRAVLFLGVSLAGSLLWMTVVQLIPAGSRPYIDGSTNNNVFSMVFGYNGFNRLIPHLIPGAAPDFVHVIFQHQHGGGAEKLLLPATVSQVGWLYPLALCGVVFAIVALRRRRGEVNRGSTATGVAITVWLALAAALLSAADIPHTAYFAAISVQVAVLSSVAILEAIRLYRAGNPRARLVLPALLAAEVGWTLVVLVLTVVAPLWLIIAVGIAGGAATAALAAGIRAEPARRITRPAIAVGLAAVLLAPAAWSASTVDLSLDGSANDAYGGPRIGSTIGFFRAPGTTAQTTTFTDFAVNWPQWVVPDRSLSPADSRLLAYLRARLAGHASVPRQFLLATTTWARAATLILGAGANVLPMGGFSGGLPSPTLDGFEHLVSSHRVRFVELPATVPAPRAHATETRQIERWVRAFCAPVGISSPTTSGTVPGRTLWDCSAMSLRRAVPQARSTGNISS